MAYPVPIPCLAPIVLPRDGHPPHISLAPAIAQGQEMVAEHLTAADTELDEMRAAKRMRLATEADVNERRVRRAAILNLHASQKYLGGDGAPAWAVAMQAQISARLEEMQVQTSARLEEMQVQTSARLEEMQAQQVQTNARLGQLDAQCTEINTSLRCTQAQIQNSERVSG